MIKIKFSMTYVYKEYEGKIKMVQDQWLQLKMMFLLGYNMKIVIYWGIKIWGWVYWEDFSWFGRDE